MSSGGKGAFPLPRGSPGGSNCPVREIVEGLRSKGSSASGMTQLPPRRMVGWKSRMRSAGG
jgi:hypothetical protein